MIIFISILLTTLLQNSYLLVPETNEYLSTVVYIATTHLQISVWLFAFITFLPYKQLMYKCILMIYALQEIALALQIMLLTDENLPIFLLSLSVFTSWLLFIVLRSYRIPNDTIDLNHFFYFKHRPDSLQDSVVALFGSPTGGNAIYQNGIVYHFHKGELKRTQYSKFTKAMRAKWQIKKGEPTNVAKIRRLEEAVGSPWKWNHNCQTVLYPIVKWGHPLSLEGVVLILKGYMEGSK